MISVDVRLFSAALICVSKEETRYYLNGVYVQPHPEKGALLVATDGHRLLVLHDEAGKCTKSGIIAAKKPMIAAALKTATSLKSRDGTLNVDDKGFVSIPAVNYQSFKSGLIDGTFPDWPRVVHPMLGLVKAKKHSLASFNARYLADFGKIADILERSKVRGNASARFVPFVGNSTPALVLFPGFDGGFGILMPISTPEVDALPLFMKPVLEPKKKVARRKAA